MKSERILLLAAVVLLAAGMAVGVSAPTLHGIGIGLRLVAILLLGVFALRRRSLTP